jgi:hypothetical protein
MTAFLALATRSRVCVMAVLFVLVQYASVLHAVDHPFHEDDPSCDVFHAIEKSKSLLADGPVVITSGVYLESRILESVQHVTAKAARRYLARAPPVSSLA